MTTERDEAVRDRAIAKLAKALAHADGHHSIGLTKPECSALIAALRDGEGCGTCGGRGWIDEGHLEDDGRMVSAPEDCPDCTPPAKQPEAQAVIPKAKDWLEQINGAASREWMDGWDACRVEYELFLATQQPEAQAVAWPEGLIDRIKSAEQRIHDNHAPRRIPADPTDVDLVLAEARLFLEGKPAPFWLKPACPPVEKAEAQAVARLVIVDRGGGFKAIRTWDDIGDLPPGEHFLFSATHPTTPDVGVEDWKARALAAEADIERMTDAFNRENGPTFMGEPVLPPEKTVELEPGGRVPAWLLDYAKMVELYMKANLPGPWRIGGIQSHDYKKEIGNESLN